MVGENLVKIIRYSTTGVVRLINELKRFQQAAIGWG